MVKSASQTRPVNGWYNTEIMKTIKRSRYVGKVSKDFLRLARDMSFEIKLRRTFKELNCPLGPDSPEDKAVWKHNLSLIKAGMLPHARTRAMEFLTKLSRKIDY